MIGVVAVAVVSMLLFCCSVVDAVVFAAATAADLFVVRSLFFAVAQAGLQFPGLGYEPVAWYDQFNEFASKNPGGLAQVSAYLPCCFCSCGKFTSLQ